MSNYLWIKRPIPSENELLIRKNSQLSNLDLTDKLGFMYGNNKTGSGGGIYNKVLVWNMPNILTCPGASKYCANICYNLTNKNILGEKNFQMFNEDKKQLIEIIHKQITTISSCGKVAVRIHSSGDFFSNEYINMWLKIIISYPEVSFWSYTRSWNVKGLKKGIEVLSELKNLNLYYSWDETMPVVNYKKAIIISDLDNIFNRNERGKCVVCPEQFGLVQTCSDCGICMMNTSDNILFLLH